MEANNPASLPLDDLHTVEELASKYPRILSTYTLRWQLRDREKNGLAPACVRVGKKLLISKTRYEQWLAVRAGNAARAA